jgi:PKD repeat protein
MNIKLLIKTILIVVCSIGTAFSQLPTNGLVGYWPFTGNANDNSGNNNHGTVIGATLTMDRFGNPNSAYYLDGLSNYISIANSSSLNPTTGITICAWYKTISFMGAGFSPIVDKGFTQHTYPLYQYKMGVSGDQYTNSGTYFGFRVTAADSLRSVQTNLNYVSINQWYFIVGRYDGKTLNMYVNNQLIQSINVSGLLNNYLTPVYFGNNTTANDFLKGTIDDIRIYNRAITNDEIFALYKENTCTAADFSYTQDTVSKSISFKDKTIGKNLKWYWDYGNGESSTLQNPQNYKFPIGGVYPVCLTVRDSIQGCQNRMCYDIKANNVADCRTKFYFSTDGSTTKVQFDGKSLNTANSYYWSFGNGDYSTVSNPIYTYPTIGNFKVCLATRDNVIPGCQSRFCDVVHAGSVDCKAKFTALPDAVSQGVNFSDESEGNTTAWYWDFGDGHTSGLQNPFYKYAAPGYYKVCLTTTSVTNCQNTYCNNVHVGNTDCKTSFSYFTDPVKLSTEFRDLSLNSPSSWAWEFGDGNTSTLQNPQHIYANGGIYTTCLTTKNALGCISHTCEDLVAGPIGADCQAGFEIFEHSNNASFKNTSIGNADSWFWDFGDLSYSTLTNPTHTYTTGGYYTVSLTMYNVSSGCFNTYFKNVTIGTTTSTKNCHAKYSYIANPNTNDVAFREESIGDAVSWNWSFSDSTTSTLRHPTHTFKSPGFYQVCLTVKSSDGTPHLFCNEVGIGKTGLASTFIAKENDNYYYKNNTTYPVTFYGASYGTPSKWKWEFGDNSSDSLRVNVTHNYSNPGSYNVCLTTSDPIAKLSSRHCNIQKVASVTGNKENVSSIFNLNVFPNPIINQANISYTISGSKYIQLSIYNLHGEKLKLINEGEQQGQINQTIDIADLKLAQGMYLINLNVEGKSYSKPILISK